ncbi:hypothetical protein GS3922_07260 [Geobacillus subterraneus]|uniref:FeoB-type G domain-containing protein n=1 Tax=Geobacillus subterraneus TaxID=129338 RepID=A0ABN4NFQ6_9BACL|nr:hypothetical protein GS3922_07260 [Geobacillus subterraneus]KZS26513.1 hypothetical protein A5418_10865 [Geobacillus subterraneus]
MVDVAEKRGVKIDAAKLSRHLGVPVVPVIARTGKGTKELSCTMQIGIRFLYVLYKRENVS